MIKIIVSLLLAASSLLATSSELKWEGNTYHSGGTGKVLHDGDFIEFSLKFNAACFNDRTEAANHVTTNIGSFVEWVNLNQANTTGGAVTYDDDVINVWRQDGQHYSPNSDYCDGKYFASQSVTIVLNRSEEAATLEAVTVQGFYSALQLAIWPLNSDSNEPGQAYVSTTIADVEKGVYEATADALRRSAKAKARAKATADFLDFLGDNRPWRLQNVDFTEGGYAGAYKTSLENAVPAAIAPGGAHLIPATLKLKPLTFNVTGNFTFAY